MFDNYIAFCEEKLLCTAIPLKCIGTMTSKKNSMLTPCWTADRGSSTIGPNAKRLFQASKTLDSKDSLRSTRRKHGLLPVPITASKKPLEPGIYFDAGTGRGNGVEVSVTDEKGQSLLDKILSKNQINQCGKYVLSGDVTNNYGELLACSFALQIALKTKAQKIFGDSKLVLDFWSKGHIKSGVAPPKTGQLAYSVAKLRKEFESKGGSLEHISGEDNPADLGFHK